MTDNRTPAERHPWLDPEVAESIEKRLGEEPPRMNTEGRTMSMDEDDRG